MKRKQTITATIMGGRRLSGEVSIVPNKNAILPALAASIGTKQVMEYHHIPQSPDVKKMLGALRHMGAEIDDQGATIHICCKDINTSRVPSDPINDMQAGFLFAGPLLARFGVASIPLASGCKLGYRGPEDHAAYLGKLSIVFELRDNYINFSITEGIGDPRLSVEAHGEAFPKRTIVYKNPCVTPTENVIMLLARTSRYETEISGIAQEPHVAQLLALIAKMGAVVKGKGSTVSIIGVDELKGASFTAEPDHVDYFGFATLAAMTKSDLLLRVPQPLSIGILQMNEYLSETGIQLGVVDDGVMVYGSKSAYEPSASFPKADPSTYKVNPGPWPMFPVDCLPSMIAWGSMNPAPSTATRYNNWLYTDALKYVAVMKEMGAKVSFIDDQRALIQGTPMGNPYQQSAHVTAPDVIEGARAVINCALAGKRKCIIQNAQYILRRNPDFFDLLRKLGADIDIEIFEEPASEIIR